MISKDRINILLNRYLYSSLSQKETDELFGYIKLEMHEALILKAMHDQWQRDESRPSLSIEKKDGLYLRLTSDPRFHCLTDRNAVTKANRSVIKIASAAAAMLIITLGLHFYSSVPKSDIPPGYSRATLTLSDGKKINLHTTGEKSFSDPAGTGIHNSLKGQLAYAINNPKPLSGSNLRFNTLQTPKGGHYQVILPDGTKVWLNASSSLKYPSSFSSLKKREVWLQGEAYFEVAPNKSVPFHVLSNGQDIKVTGTRFNVNAYDDEPNSATTLLEGEILLTNISAKCVKLKPGQQAIVRDGIAIKNVDPENAIDWKNGDFLLKGEDFKTTMRKISRWYDAEVIYSPSAPQDLELGGWVSRSKNISAVLKIMESTGKVHFKVEGRRIIVTK